MPKGKSYVTKKDIKEFQTLGRISSGSRKAQKELLEGKSKEVRMRYHLGKSKEMDKKWDNKVRYINPNTGKIKRK